MRREGGVQELCTFPRQKKHTEYSSQAASTYTGSRFPACTLTVSCGDSESALCAAAAESSALELAAACAKR
jgi:hypothetical protein